MSRNRHDIRHGLSMLIIGIGFFLPCFLHSSALGGLYECTDGSGSRIFTDRPAQLQRCSPLPASQNQSSSTSTAQTVAPLPYQNALPAAIDPPPAPFTPAQDNSAMQGSNQVPPQPCTPGFNPLNPLTAPPCHPVIPGQTNGAANVLNGQ